MSTSVRAALCGMGIALSAGIAGAQETSVGVALTSDYLSNGLTQSGGNPALQAYVEHGFATGFYVGVWASTVDLAPDNLEVDLYLGFRNEVGALSYDVSYYRYYYDDSGDCCGEAFLSLGYAVSDQVSLGLEMKSDLEGSLFVTPELGYDFGNGLSVGGLWRYEKDSPERYWSVAGAYALDNGASVEVAYHDRTDAAGRFTLTLAFDTTLGR